MLGFGDTEPDLKPNRGRNPVFKTDGRLLLRFVLGIRRTSRPCWDTSRRSSLISTGEARRLSGLASIV
jgi:hypothetical protein